MHNKGVFRRGAARQQYRSFTRWNQSLTRRDLCSVGDGLVFGSKISYGSTVKVESLLAVSSLWKSKQTATSTLH